MATTNSVPKPKNQGGHASASANPVNVQKKQPATNAGKSTIEYGFHTAGHGGTNKGANKVKKG